MDRPGNRHYNRVLICTRSHAARAGFPVWRLVPKMSTRNIETEMRSGQSAEGGGGVRSILIAYLVLIGSQIPLSLIYFFNLEVSRPHYRLFPLAFLVFGILLYRRWPRGTEQPFFPSHFSMVLLVCGLVLAICGTLWLSPWFGYASLLAFLGSLLARTNDHGRFGTLISLLAPLLVLLQPPTGIDFDNVQGDVQLMQTINVTAAAIASDLFDVAGIANMGYFHIHTGSRIELVDGTIDAIDIGTRSNSVFTLLILTGIYIAIRRRPVFRAGVLLVACVWWATFGESLEMVLSVVGTSSFGLDWLDNATPAWLRLICLAIALGLVLLTDSLITFLFDKVDMTSIDEDQKFQYWLCQSWNFAIAGHESPVIDNNVRREVNWARWRNSLPSLQVLRFVQISAVLCLLLTVFQVIEIGRAAAAATSPQAFSGYPGSWLPLDRKTLPDELLGARLQDFSSSQPDRRSAFRTRENRWTWYDPANESVQYLVTISQAWPGWHDAFTQHERLGWFPDSERRNGETGLSGVIPDLPIAVNHFHNTIGERSLVAVCQLDAFGEPVQQPLTWQQPSDFWRRAADRLGRRIRPRLLAPDVFVVQVEVRTLGPVPEMVERRALQLLEATTAILQTAIQEGRLPRESGSPDTGVDPL